MSRSLKQGATLATPPGVSSFQPFGSAAVPFMSRIAAGNESAAMLVMGDSTGDETNVQGRWPLKTAQWLAATFPAYTVNFHQWNLTANNWDALGTNKSVVLQTGTGTGNAGGPFVIDVWNSSASGMAPSYHYGTTVFNTATNAATPQLVVINHGHNIGGASGAQGNYEIHKLARSIHDKFPLAGIMVTSQNPSSGQSDTANDYLRARAVQSLAAQEGYGLVNILNLFLKNSNYPSLLADGLHPNDTGSRMWADEVIKLLSTGREPGTTPKNPNNQQDRIWVPATAFSAYSGSPTLALTNSNAMMWAFPQAAVSSIITTVDLPPHWTSYDTYIMWAVAGSSGYTGSTVVSWRMRRQQQAGGGSLPVGQFAYPLPAWNDTGAVSLNPNNGTAYQTVISRLAQQSSPSNAPMGVRIERTGNNGTDNILETAYLLGVMFVKAATV